ncbi:MAG: gamma-glutamylcyclotransferase [Gammaproteobacteria bacterium]|nr:gamma-glutamylcyclotransferase [Gammaproteobacteria bacterium]
MAGAWIVEEPSCNVRITQPTWVFGYGSLIWKQDFPYLESRPGRISGGARQLFSRVQILSEVSSC